MLLDRRDLLGQAQTGTSKTTAFALPILEGIDIKRPCAPGSGPSVPPGNWPSRLPSLPELRPRAAGFHVLPIYGGQSYTIQLKQLPAGAHVIIRYPGRIMDHLERKDLISTP